jgi:hypothetical protein
MVTNAYYNRTALATAVHVVGLQFKTMCITINILQTEAVLHTWLCWCYCTIRTPIVEPASCRGSAHLREKAWAVAAEGPGGGAGGGGSRGGVGR